MAWGVLVAVFRPFLKWAGGKRQLLPVLVGHVLRLGTFRAYHEPFVGGGALFFELRNLGLVADGARLSDVNGRLIEAYQGVADQVEPVIALLREHASRHSRDHYYAVRGANPASLAERAARLIYLNRTCFNGLYRENRQGGFNVPMGRYTNPTICDEPGLRTASDALRVARLSAGSFVGVLDQARAGDLVYFDPPYVPLSRTASFTAYAREGFSMADQERLAEVFGVLADRGVHVMLSNSRTDAVLSMYARFRIDVVQAARSVNSRADRRGCVDEVVVTSF